jgi:hypothetical protein
MRRLDRLARSRAGIERKSGKQPWCLSPEIPKHTITQRFTFNSETNLSGAEFATEDIDLTDIVLDGVPVEKNITGYFTDESIQKTLLPEITPGKHTIEITKPLAPRTYNENCFLLGDFNVRLEGIESTLVAPTREIGFGSVVSQGMPFYGANIKYCIDVEVPDEGCGLNIHSHFYRGSLISVSVDGECVGKIAYNPYTVTVPAVAPGKHTVELTVFGNRHNSFGALHSCDREFRWFGPMAWFVQGDEFTYEHQLKEFGILSSPVIEVTKKK